MGTFQGGLLHLHRFWFLIQALPELLWTNTGSWWSSEICNIFLCMVSCPLSGSLPRCPALPQCWSILNLKNSQGWFFFKWIQGLSYCYLLALHRTAINCNKLIIGSKSNLSAWLISVLNMSLSAHTHTVQSCRTTTHCNVADYFTNAQYLYSDGGKRKKMC